MSIRRFSATVVACILFLALPAHPAWAQLSKNMQEMLTRIGAGEFGAGGGRTAGSSGRWVDGGQAYVATERTSDGATELVRYDTATGQRQVVMTATQLTPPQLGKPLQVADYS